jgi:hypothetical protein
MTEKLINNGCVTRGYVLSTPSSNNQSPVPPAIKPATSQSSQNEQVVTSSSNNPNR